MHRLRFADVRLAPGPISNWQHTMSFLKLYYLLKPVLPVGLRRAVRSHFALRTAKRSAHVWPIDESAARPPDGWEGWPEGKRFAFILTHDVEGPEGLERVKPLAELEMSLGFRSSFNFVPEGAYRVSKELRDWLLENGFEVGVHDLHHDGKLYRSREYFLRCAERINHYLKDWSAVGYRSGFMLRNLEWHHDLDVLYDCTTFDTDPFEPQPDGAGTIFPFWIGKSGRSENEADRKGYVELPYTFVQDSTLFFLLRETTPRFWSMKLDWLAQKGGMALLNTHPDYMYFGRKESGRFAASLYADFLRDLCARYDGEYWHVLPRRLAAWYREMYVNRSPVHGAY